MSAFSDTQDAFYLQDNDLHDGSTRAAVYEGLIYPDAQKVFAFSNTQTRVMSRRVESWATNLNYWNAEASLLWQFDIANSLGIKCYFVFVDEENNVRGRYRYHRTDKTVNQVRWGKQGDRYRVEPIVGVELDKEHKPRSKR